MRLLPACLVLACLPAFSQDLPRDVPVEEWRAQALGNSVHYYIGEDYIGREFWLPDGRSVRYEDAQGNCQDGAWFHKDDVYCFAWPGSFICARHVEIAEGWYGFPTVESDGTPVEDDGQRGEIVAGGFTCGPGMVS